MQKNRWMKGRTVMTAVLTGVMLSSVNSLPVMAQPAAAEQSAVAENTSVSEHSGSQVFESLKPIGPGIPKEEAEPEPLSEAPEVPAVSIGEQVVSYASQFIGNPYVFGGTSLTNGADCSGFVMKVFQQFGVSLPRTSRDQGRSGMNVGGLDQAKPGDVVSYKGHIGIYMGQNQLVHASNKREGIKVSHVNYKPILSIRRFL